MASVDEQNARRGFTVQTLRNKARRYGATVEGGVVGKHASYNIDAPQGKVWAASSTHALAVYWRTDEPAYRNDSIVDALERMEEGLADCDDPDCDICCEAHTDE
ncbi:MAG TPA: hypothetical protein VEA69_00160 [Tepidisphaeraceae bacterium]|nr:hypothetical protein [Tepidisphaeraceae bacterium]